EDDKAEGGVAARAAKWLTWWRVSGGELSALLAALRELDALPADGSPAALQRAQLAQLSDRVADAELRCAALQVDAEILRTLAGGAGRALASAAPALASAAEALAGVYHHVCAVNGTQPERLLLEHAGQTDIFDESAALEIVDEYVYLGRTSRHVGFRERSEPPYPNRMGSVRETPSDLLIQNTLLLEDQSFEQCVLL
ncbi:jg9412, partial [Pararge aegeria aegeria]